MYSRDVTRNVARSRFCNRPIGEHQALAYISTRDNLVKHAAVAFDGKLAEPVVFHNSVDASCRLAIVRTQ